MKTIFKGQEDNNGCAEIDVSLGPVQHKVNKLAIWKQKDDEEICYGLTIWGTEEDAPQYDYDTFTEKEIVEFIRKAVDLVKYKL